MEKLFLAGGDKYGELVFNVRMGITHWYRYFPFVFGWNDISAL